MYLKYCYYYLLLLLSFIYYHHHPTRIFACISLLPPPFVKFLFIHTCAPIFCFFFLEAKREAISTAKNTTLSTSLNASRRPLLLHKKLFHALTGTCTLLTRRDLIHRSPSTYLHRREYICRKYTSSISIRTHF